MKAMGTTAPRELAEDEVALPRLDARHVLVRHPLRHLWN
jgi:hypothetical protein